MKCIKNIIDEDNYEIIVSDENENKFKMCCDGSDLYWAMDEYYQENEFIVTKDNKDLFLKIHYLFLEVYRFDNKEHQFIKENKFEWVSEARIPEISNKLIIEYEKNFYRIKFIQNQKDMCSVKRNSCYIFFSLLESKSQEVVNAFFATFLSYKYYDLEPKVKKIKLY